MHIEFNQSEGFEELSKMADRFRHCVKEAINDPELAEKLRRFGSQFDSGFSQTFRRGTQDEKTAGSSKPLSNCYKLGDGSLVFEFLLPGFELAGIDIRFRGDTMFLSARLPEGPADQDKPRYTEQGFTLKNYERLEYQVAAEDYAQNQTKAVMRNGILVVTIPEKDDDPSVIRVEISKEGN